MTALSPEPSAVPADAPPPGAPAGPLLAVTDLTVETGPGPEPVPLVEDVAFEVEAGRTLSLVGESGSGKTLTALSILGLLPAGVRRASGRVVLGEQDLASLPPRQLRSVRGRDVGMVFQDPAANLDPSFTVGSQLVETIRAHTDISRRAARDRAADLLERVGIPEPGRRLRDHPHQLSGGMAQRVMVALAISCRPRLLIADEPTTALDVTVQAQILTLLRSLQEEHGMALLLVSHDLSVVAEMADQVAVLYAGQVVERGEVAAVFDRPEHPYTEALLGAQPGTTARGQAMVAIAGAVPTPAAMPEGCRFHPRCTHATEACRTGEPPLVELAPGPGARVSRCLRRDDLTLRGVGALLDAVEGVDGDPAPAGAGSPGDAPEGAVLVRAQDLGRDYLLREGRLPWSRSKLSAVDAVTFEIRAGETLGLVGESGAGKSTVGRLVLGLEEPSRGSVLVDGVDLRQARGRRGRELRRDVQVVFQDPNSSLDPLMSVGASLAEPLEVHTDLRRTEVSARVAELLEQVGLDPAVAGRRPDELSGGQRQRIGIARALALSPRLIVCDEPVSALDVSTQAQVINLLAELQRELGVAYLFIGHDLSVVHQISDRIAVMRRGRIVEIGNSDQVYRRPRHPYTRALIDAVLSVDPQHRRLGQPAAEPEVADPDTAEPEVADPAANLGRSSDQGSAHGVID